METAESNTDRGRYFVKINKCKENINKNVKQI